MRRRLRTTWAAWGIAFALSLAACGSGPGGETPPPPARASLSGIVLQGVDGEPVPLSGLAEAPGSEPRLLVLRHMASWCGPCQWQAANTLSMLPNDLARRVKVVDVLLAGEDNGPPTQADQVAWLARQDLPTATVLPDADFKLAGLFPARAKLPLIALVDAQSLVLLDTLVAPGPDAFTQAVRSALAQQDGSAPPAAMATPRVDGRFDHAEWALVQAMALAPPTVDATNAYEADARAIAWGRQLFFDGDLSPAPKRVSCAACHVPELHFQDAKDQASEGVGSGQRNVPTVVLATDARWQFWDGRADSAWSQAVMPIEDPTEMASSRLYVAHQVQARYAETYTAIFGALPALDDLTRFPLEGRPGDAAWTAMSEADRQAVNRVFANLGKALAAYECSLRPRPNALDRYAGGDTEALTPAQKDGLQAFFQAGCIQCHHGPRLSDDAFHVLRFPTGRPDRQADAGRAGGLATLAASEFRRSGPYSDAPSAALEPATSPRMLGTFKTPGLRGVGLTLPYGHGGSFGGLTSTLEAHRSGGLPPDSPYASGVTEPWLADFDPVLIPKIEVFLRALTVELAP